MPARFELRSLSSRILFLLLVRVLASAQNISTLTPNSGPIGTSVTIAGSGFGASQGSSTVAFNGTNATPTSWSDTQIVAPVPSGATTGNVVVTANGTASNGVNFTVTTIAASLQSITVTPANASVSAGNTQPFDAVGTYSDGSTQDVTSTASWSSTDTTVAAVDASGNATGFNDGQITIQAALGGIVGSAALTVTPGQLNAVVTPAYQTTGGSVAFLNGRGIGVGKDGFSRMVTWDTSAVTQDDEITYVHCLGSGLRHLKHRHIRH